MNDEYLDKLAIRELIENWVVWRDAGDWERFADCLARRRSDDGDLVPGPRRGLHPRHQEGWNRGRQILHFLGGTRSTRRDRGRSQDQDDDLAARARSTASSATWSAQVGSTTSSRGATALGDVLRQPIYEQDRLDPVDPAARTDARRDAARPSFPAATATSPTSAQHRLQVKPDMPRLTGPEVEGSTHTGRSGSRVRANHRKMTCRMSAVSNT